jgi:beta-xylosidase
VRKALPRLCGDRCRSEHGCHGVGPRELYDVYARPFEAALRLAGLAGVMASYSEFEGVPIHVSRAVLTDLLRKRMGFTGAVVSD